MVDPRNRNLIVAMIDDSIAECEKEAEMMRHDNNSLNDQGVLSLVHRILHEKFRKILDSENQFHGA